MEIDSSLVSITRDAQKYHAIYFENCSSESIEYQPTATGCLLYNTVLCDDAFLNHYLIFKVGIMVCRVHWISLISACKSLFWKSVRQDCSTFSYPQFWHFLGYTKAWILLYKLSYFDLMRKGLQRINFQGIYWINYSFSCSSFSVADETCLDRIIQAMWLKAISEILCREDKSAFDFLLYYLSYACMSLVWVLGLKFSSLRFEHWWFWPILVIYSSTGFYWVDQRCTNIELWLSQESR